MQFLIDNHFLELKKSPLKKSKKKVVEVDSTDTFGYRPSAAYFWANKYEINELK